MTDNRVQRALRGDSSVLVSRVFALDDIEIVPRSKGGDGRTVTAYAAVFGSPTEIVDQDGHYNEEIERSAFDKTLADRSRAVGVFYNHARTLHGTPSEMASVPLGRPLEIRPDKRGLLTVTRYNNTQLASDVLDSIANGDITGQSFTGVFLRSSPDRGPWFQGRNGQLQTVTRQEIALIEYGPTPIPAYKDAAIIGVRNREFLMGDQENAGDGQTPPGDDGRERTTVTITVDHGGAAARASTSPPAVDEPAGQGEPPQPPAVDEPTNTDHPGTSGEAGTESNGAGSGERTGEPSAAPSRAEPPAKHSANGTTTKPSTRSAAMPEGTNHPMTVEERAARQEDIRVRLREIDEEYAGAEMPDQARSEWNDLLTELGTHDRAIADASARAEVLRQLADNPNATLPGADPASGYADAANAQRNGGIPAGSSRNADPAGAVRSRFSTRPALSQRVVNLYDLTEVRQQARSIEEVPALMRERAMVALEQATFPAADDADAVKGRVERLLKTKDDKQGTLAKRMLLTGSPAYERAFSKAVAALSIAGLTTEESRALSMGTPAAFEPGSFPVPFQLDPTVTLTSNGAINPLRSISRVEQIVGKEWLGVTSTGITVQRGTDVSGAGGNPPEAADGTPPLTQPGVAPQRVQGFVPFSVEVEQDWTGLMAEIAMMLADAKDVEESDSFINGDGTGTNAGGVIGTLANTQFVQTVTAGAFTVPDDLDSIEAAMAPRFRKNASWIAAKATFGAIRKAAVASGDQFDVWARLNTGTPPELIGYSAYEASDMATDLTSTTVPYLLMGDFRQFIIVDRIGMSVELVPHLFGANGRPTGQRGIYAIWRNNSAILAQNAFRGLVSKAGA